MGSMNQEIDHKYLVSNHLKSNAFLDKVEINSIGVRISGY